MNPEQLLAHAKRLTATLSRQQLVTLGLVFVAVVGLLVGSAYWINTPTYAVLFADMDAESASSVVSKLKAEKIQYVLDDGGRTVRVPQARVDELRLDFSSQGMPTSGRIGFEIFDRTAFGTTEFLEQVNYRRALEGELARTIGTIAEVQSARVHIAMAKPSLFASDAQPAKASVVLKLKGRKALAPGTIAGITGLVAASVESLRPEAVVVLDTFGRSMSARPDDEAEDEASGLKLDRQRRIERDLTQKVVSLLEPIVGEGGVRVNVTARLNADTSEETLEQWDPTTVLRSRQMSAEAGNGLGPAAGVAGARANTPAPVPAEGDTPAAAAAPAPTPLPVALPGGPSRTTESTNYEVSKLTRHTVTPSGQVARLSVAVLLDDDRTTEAGSNGEAGKPAARSPQDMERIQQLVSSAVGIDTERGDQLTVQNISFDDGMQAVPEAPKTVMQKVTTFVQSDGAADIGRTFGLVLIVGMAFLFVLRPMIRGIFPPVGKVKAMQLPLPAGAAAMATAAGVAVAAAGAGGAGAQPGSTPPTVGEMQQQMEAQLAAAREQRRLPALTRTAAKVVEEEPESVARLIRGWLSEEEH